MRSATGTGSSSVTPNGTPRKPSTTAFLPRNWLVFNKAGRARNLSGKLRPSTAQIQGGRNYKELIPLTEEVESWQQIACDAAGRHRGTLTIPGRAVIASLVTSKILT